MNRTYASYDRGDPWPQTGIESNPYYNKELALVRSAIGEKKMMRFLDLGSGYGRASSALESKVNNIVLMDGSLRMLEKTKKHLPKAERVAAEIESSWPIRSASFDLIVGLQIVNHAQDLYAFFRELRRVLAPQGEAYLSVGNGRSWIQWRSPQTPSIQVDGFVRHVPEVVETAASEAGLISKVIGGSGLFSPHRKLIFLEGLNRFDWSARLSHLVVMQFLPKGSS